MPKVQKFKILVLLTFATVLLALLAVSLPLMEMQPGEIISLQIPDGALFGENQAPLEVDWFFVFLQGFLVLLVILSLVYALISLFDQEARRKLLIDLLKFGLLFLLLLLLTRQKLPEAVQEAASITPQPGFSEPPAFTGEMPVSPSFEAHPQPWMWVLTTLGAAVLFAVITYAAVRFFTARTPVPKPQFQELAANAQIALVEITEAQLDFNDVIIRCYAEMSQVLQTEGGIERAQTLTPQEFEHELLLKGFPAGPVQRLTQLFEQVRYGRQRPQEKEKEIAAESLSAIIEFCRGLE